MHVYYVLEELPVGVIPSGVLVHYAFHAAIGFFVERSPNTFGVLYECEMVSKCGFDIAVIMLLIISSLKC